MERQFSLAGSRQKHLCGISCEGEESEQRSYQKTQYGSEQNKKECDLSHLKTDRSNGGLVRSRQCPRVAIAHIALESSCAGPFFATQRRGICPHRRRKKKAGRRGETKREPPYLGFVNKWVGEGGGARDSAARNPSHRGVYRSGKMGQWCRGMDPIGVTVSA